MKPQAPYFRDLQARLDAYSERRLDEMDKYQNRKAAEDFACGTHHTEDDGDPPGQRADPGRPLNCP
jgi:hypothetical protein